MIVGGGTAGWMSATVTSQLFKGKLDIELVESEAIGTVGVGEATIPPILAFNSLAGVDEAEFIRQTKATFKLAIQFQNWGAVGDSYYHGFGYIGHKVGAIPFQQVWLKGLSEGVAGPLSDYSFNNRACDARRFNRISQISGTPLSGISYAYHFDAGLYAAYLRKLSEARGVVRTEGRISEVVLDPETGNVAKLQLESGAEVAGDFFIDCSGFNSLVFAKALGVEYDDWSEWLLCNRAAAVPSSLVPESVRPYTQSIAHGAGWQWRIPLQHRTGNGHVFCDEFISEDEATQTLLDNLEGEALRDPLLLRFTPGCRKKLWHKNCIALGLSSGFIEPLESTSIHLIQLGILHFLNVFPDMGDNSAKQKIYNQRMRFDYERIRDFIILHYHQTEREDTPFWKHVKHMTVPDTLVEKMDAFRESGHLYRIDDELFTEVGWLQVMIGQGLMPRSYSAMADTLSTDEVREFLGNLDTVFSNAVKNLQPYEQFLKACAA